MRVIWTAPARRDVRSHVSYVAERNRDAAQKLRADIRQSVGGLADYPNRGRPGRVQGTRELPIVGTSYVVIYRVMEAQVEILRVLHGAQEWPSSGP